MPSRRTGRVDFPDSAFRFFHVAPFPRTDVMLGRRLKKRAMLNLVR